MEQTNSEGATRRQRRHSLASPKGILLWALAVCLISAGVLGIVLKLQVPSGRLKWARQVGPQWRGSPTVSNGIVYIGTRENKVFALRAEIGRAHV